ncbi:hypothetical protein [Yersinia aleksiciae]|uniref:Flagellin lysine-N-methylase n=1 Tax=Yersinia aleksiciae TaxID=263819 RepID=A0A0T9TNL0_YERAE|nr:hypothetical protein [Yersinia aleksiciae]CNK93327.1 flagellin lysine-N-methylase [Yersinia aleksiciae]
MKELQIIQPEFVERFSCVGSACRDHCCNGWDINIDKILTENIRIAKTKISGVSQ